MAVPVPRIMKFTVLPYSLAAKAWLDTSFEQTLAAHPKAILLENSSSFPREFQYVLLRDRPSAKHYVIPFINRDEFSNDREISELIHEETSASPEFDEFLPPNVLFRALTDDTFLQSLISQPFATLRELGYLPPSPPIVVQNSARTFHIPLRVNKYLSQDFGQLYSELRSQGGQILSSGCCASGTRTNAGDS